MTWWHEDRKLRRQLPVWYISLPPIAGLCAEWHTGDGWWPQSTCRGLMLTLNIPRTRHPPRGGYSHKVALKTWKPLFSPIVAHKITKNSCSSNNKWMDWRIFDLSNWLLSQLLSLLFIILFYFFTSPRLLLNLQFYMRENILPCGPAWCSPACYIFAGVSAALQMSVNPQASTMVTHTLLCVLLSLATARVQGLDTVESEDGDPRVGWAVEVSTGHREIMSPSPCW